jgi:hypothetical protein
MSEAREIYYTHKSIFNDLNAFIDPYVNELEQQKAELIDFVKAMRVLGSLNSDRLSEYSDTIYHTSNDILNKLQKEN